MYLMRMCLGQRWGSQNCWRISGWVSTSVQDKDNKVLWGNLSEKSWMALWQVTQKSNYWEGSQRFNQTVWKKHNKVQKI